jgi:tetratricopeptide (TPR) repeat protein
MGEAEDIPARLAAAGQLAKDGRPDEAEAIFQAILAQQPDQFHATLGLAYCARARGDRATSLARFRAVDERYPESVWTRIEIAADLRALDRIEEAEAVYRQVLKDRPGYLHASIGLGYCARLRGDRAAALACFRSAAETHPHEVFPWLETAEELRAIGRIDEAEAAYRRALAEQPANLQAALGLGYCARSRSDNAEALARFRATANAHPNEILPLMEVSTELRELGELDEAESICRTVLKGQPGQLHASLGLGYCARARADRVAALAQFRLAADANPADVWSRLEVAAELCALDRVEEAETALRAILSEHPGQLQVELSLGHCARVRGDRVAALAQFQATAAAHPREIRPRLEVAAEFRDKGDFESAVAVCDEVLTDHPNNVDAWLSIAASHMSAGCLEEALKAFELATTIQPFLLSPKIRAARAMFELGEHAASRKMLEGILETSGESPEVLQEMGEQARVAQDFQAAEAFFRRALDISPQSVGAVHGLAQTLADAGHAEDALAFLLNFANTPERTAAIGPRIVSILRQIGCWDQALKYAREGCAAAPRNFWLWQQKLHLDMLMGNDDAAREALGHSPAVTAGDLSATKDLLGQFAELHYRYDEAISHYRNALSLSPKNLWAKCNLARSLLLNVNVDEATEALKGFAALDRSMALVQGRSTKASQSLLGQLIDEYLLDVQSLKRLTEIWSLPPTERSGPLLDLVRLRPDYTPAAIAWVTTLKQAGDPASPKRTGNWRFGASIPKAIAQYWHSPGPPDDVKNLMKSWRDNNPSYEYYLFDDASTQEFLRDFTPDVLAAYRRASAKAQKADLFRLAWLYAHGGYYADADDRCLAPLDEHIPAGSTLVLYQEDVGTLGNDFIGATPHHWIVGHALGLATDAVNRSDQDILWLSTGPGVVTRAFAQALASSRLACSEWLKEIAVLGRTRLHRFVVPHCACAYKNSLENWQRAAFRQGRMPGPRISPGQVGSRHR